MKHLGHILGMALLALLVLAPPGVAEELRVAWSDGKDYVLVKDLARAYSMEIQGPYGKVMALENRWNRLVFTLNGREVKVNGTVVWLHEPLQQVKGRWAVRAVDARKILDPVLRPYSFLRQAGYRVVVLDPGHGGQDTGAKGKRGVEEKRGVLDIARRVRAQLQNAGVRVYMTRESDRFIELEDRCVKARSWGADVFVSIHLNSAADALPSGAESYTLASAGYASTAGGSGSATQPGHKHDAANAVLGYQVHKALIRRTGSVDRGVKRSRFLVLRNAPCPAVLVECAFVSNKREEEKLLTDQFRESIAQGIATGILNYLNTVKRARLAAE